MHVNENLDGGVLHPGTRTRTLEAMLTPLMASSQNQKPHSHQATATLETAAYTLVSSRACTASTFVPMGLRRPWPMRTWASFGVIVGLVPAVRGAGGHCRYCPMLGSTWGSNYLQFSSFCP